MPKYIMLSSLTDAGAQTVRKNPERIKEVNKDVEALGGKVVDQYAVIGEYDFVNILEAPDVETIARISVELGSRGSVHIHTMAAITLDEFIARLK
ncbi:MAG TPA: GYD domain-containing protein [Candidatus Anoxymicrobiaceae bacterium]